MVAKHQPHPEEPPEEMQEVQEDENLGLLEQYILELLLMW